MGPWDLFNQNLPIMIEKKVALANALNLFIVSFTSSASICFDC